METSSKGLHVVIRSSVERSGLEVYGAGAGGRGAISICMELKRWEWRKDTQRTICNKWSLGNSGSFKRQK